MLTALGFNRKQAIDKMTQTPIQLVVFDMAGTTVDENNVVYKTLRNAVQAQGFNCSLEHVLQVGGGQEKKQAIRDLLSGEGVAMANLESMVDTTYQQFTTMLKQAYHELEVKPCPGSESVFAQLREKGIKVALNTGYQKETATSLLQKLGWREGEQIDLVVTASDVPNSRPAPDMILLAMEKLGIDQPEYVVKIGDTAIDVEEGQQAGCGLCFGVLGGAQNREQIARANPDGILEHLSELTEWVEAD